ncbi:DUF5985 family protein [Noviherbaspirillum suwonense]|jgi:hypothetical protein|uniref:Lipoprotein n=1 Tax=Noviherbaspirillum suwonense TaxID=1224511 RepID=A0ABY1PSV2_9BURK|nr:DUF5985 family protein [Noviherbaspirillum suwonense]SMP45742.1 hypothetical protein SAMN06295970_101554 [Noviherbaspirillum suwonense]
MTDYYGMSHLVIGAIAALSFVIGSFFMRFWRVTGDRFFLLFGLSFWIETANRVMLGVLPAWREDLPAYYMVRLLAYALILYAIIDKNRRRD